MSYTGNTSRRRGIPNRLRVKIHQRNDNSVFYFHVAQFMKVTLPTTMLRQVTSEAFAHQNVTGVATIHHSTRDVDSYAGNIFTRVRILDVLHRPAMNSHSHGQTWLCMQCLADFQGALGRSFNRTRECQG